jgi:hypothetical protein
MTITPWDFWWEEAESSVQAAVVVHCPSFAHHVRHWAEPGQAPRVAEPWVRPWTPSSGFKNQTCRPNSAWDLNRSLYHLLTICLVLYYIFIYTSPYVYCCVLHLFTHHNMYCIGEYASTLLIVLRSNLSRWSGFLKFIRASPRVSKKHSQSWFFGKIEKIALQQLPILSSNLFGLGKADCADIFAHLPCAYPSTILCLCIGFL